MKKLRLFGITVPAVVAIAVVGLLMAGVFGGDVSAQDADNTRGGPAPQAEFGVFQVITGGPLIDTGEIVANDCVLPPGVSCTVAGARDTMSVVKTSGAMGNITVRVIDCCIQGDRMFLHLQTKNPTGPLQNSITTCVSPAVCTITHSLANGGVSLIDAGYLSVPGGFLAGYNVTIQP